MLLIYTMKEIQILHWLLIVFFVGLVIFYFVQRSSVIIGKEGLETNSPSATTFKIYRIPIDTTINGTKSYLQAQPNKNGEPIPTVSEYSEGTSFYIDSKSFSPYKLISSVDNNYFLRLFNNNFSGDSKISSQTGFINSGDYTPEQVSQQLGTYNLSTPISNNQLLFRYYGYYHYAETTPPVTSNVLPIPPVVTPSPGVLPPSVPTPPVNPVIPPGGVPLPIINPVPTPPVVTPSPLPSPPVVTPSPLPSPPGPTPPNMICTPAGSSGSSDQINVHQSKYNYNLG
jgi:hypothetical protein